MTQAPAPQVLAIFRMLIEERTGLNYAADDAALIADKVQLRAAESGFESLLDYYYFLRYDAASAAEFEALTEALVVNETYFFREYDQLKAVVDEIVVPAVRAGGTPRIWSAACSTGEEPFTVAMMLAERDALQQTQIVATDISDRALRRAQSGAFGVRSLRPRALPETGRGSLEVVDGTPRVSARVRSGVRFSRLNLLDAAGIAELGSFDVILCRNVLIYFSDETIRRVVESLSRALVPNGVLLVGASESLLRFSTSLFCEERKGAFLYRKRA